MTYSILIGKVFNKWHSLNLHQKNNSPLRTLDKCEITLPAPKKSKVSQESDGKAALHIALAKSFDEPNAAQLNTSESKKGENSLTERANLFGKTVADNLLQCDPKDWTLIKKKIFDLFFDYKQGNLTPRSTVILRSQMLLGAKTMDTLVKRMHNTRTISQVQIIGIIIKRNRYNDTISHCSHHKHHKTLTPFHRAIAITLDEMSNIKRL